MGLFATICSMQRYTVYTSTDVLVLHVLGYPSCIYPTVPYIIFWIPGLEGKARKLLVPIVANILGIDPSITSREELR